MLSSLNAFEMDLAKKSIFKGFESPVCWMCLCYDVRKESKEVLSK